MEFAGSGFLGTGFHEFRYDAGARFHEGTVIGVFERIGKVALNVDGRGEFSADENRNHNLRFHQGGSSYVSAVVRDVVDHDGLFRNRGRSAEAFAKWYSRLRGEASRVRPQDQHSGIGFVD